jgi:hypothetical protein
MVTGAHDDLGIFDVPARERESYRPMDATRGHGSGVRGSVYDGLDGTQQGFLIILLFPIGL